MERKFDLEDRLVDYTCNMIDVIEMLPTNRAGNYIAGQLIRACHSPAFNYGEVQGAESRNDFIHKLRIVLKELKECRVALKIIGKRKYVVETQVAAMQKETEELIAIISSSIQTAQRNRD